MKDEPVSAGRPVVVGYMILCLSLVAALFLVTIHSTDEARQGCARLDEVRAVEYDVLADAAASLRMQAQAVNQAQATILRSRARAYERNLHSLEVSTRPYGTGVDAHVDCERAYAYPWPFQ